jgi:NAD(P)-dependent dehydrogenase (short-subunit alcohol dehydrogenase family)
MRLLVTGGSSPIVAKIRQRVMARDPGVTIRSLGRGAHHDVRVDFSDLASVDAVRPEVVAADRILLGHGLLRPKAFLEQTGAELAEGLSVNLTSVVRLAEHALTANPDVRVAIIGSESGRKGSFDTTYALAKAGLHAYVRQRRLGHPGQQLVCVSPSMVADGRMTLERRDQDRVRQVAMASPKKRLVLADEVARLIYFALFEDDGYLCNTVIELDGGKFAGLGS